MQNLPLGNITGAGPYSNSLAAGAPRYYTTLLISNIIGLLTVFAGVWFLIQIILSGYKWLSAGADKQGVQDAQKKIQNALIGLTLVIAAIGILGLVSLFLGVNFIDFSNLVNGVRP